MLSNTARQGALRFRFALGTSLIALLGTALAPVGVGADSGMAADPEKTATPIKHVIVIIGENRTFDHLFGLYRAKPGQTVSNLRSKGILNADGTPGPNFARAAQFTVPPQANYYISAPSKAPYAVLPPPTLNGTPKAQSDTAPPFKSLALVAAIEPALEPADLILLTTGLQRPREHDGRRHARPQRHGPAERAVSADLARAPVRRLHRRHDPSLLSDVAAVRLQRAARAAGQSRRLPP